MQHEAIALPKTYTKHAKTEKTINKVHKAHTVHIVHKIICNIRYAVLYYCCKINWSRKLNNE